MLRAARRHTLPVYHPSQVIDLHACMLKGTMKLELPPTLLTDPTKVSKRVHSLPHSLTPHSLTPHSPPPPPAPHVTWLSPHPGRGLEEPGGDPGVPRPHREGGAGRRQGVAPLADRGVYLYMLLLFPPTYASYIVSPRPLIYRRAACYPLTPLIYMGPRP